MAHLRRHNGKFCQRLSLSKKPFCQAGGRGSKLSTIRNGHPAAPSGLQCSLAHWAYFALLRPQGARFVRPPPLPPLPVSAKILRIFGRGNCKEAIFALENGIFLRGVLRAPAPLNSAWSSHTFAPPCANACAVFRPCGLRFAPCPRGSSRFAASDARRLACGTPCFIGLTTACFRHWRRPSCAPAVHAAGDD